MDRGVRWLVWGCVVLAVGLGALAVGYVVMATLCMVIGFAFGMVGVLMMSDV